MIFRFADIKETEILKCRKAEIISVLLFSVISVTILIIGTVSHSTEISSAECEQDKDSLTLLFV